DLKYLEPIYSRHADFIEWISNPESDFVLRLFRDDVADLIRAGPLPEKGVGSSPAINVEALDTYEKWGISKGGTRRLELGQTPIIFILGEKEPLLVQVQKDEVGFYLAVINQRGREISERHHFELIYLGRDSRSSKLMAQEWGSARYKFRARCDDSIIDDHLEIFIDKGHRVRIAALGPRFTIIIPSIEKMQALARGEAKKRKKGAIAIQEGDRTRRFSYSIWRAPSGEYFVTNKDGELSFECGLYSPKIFLSQAGAFDFVRRWEESQQQLSERKERIEKIITEKIDQGRGRLSILFVCKGNVNRSTYAHLLTEHFVSESELQNIVSVLSGGIVGWQGGHVNPLLAERTLLHAYHHAGVPEEIIEGFSPQKLDDAATQVHAADIIFAFQRKHRDLILQRVPEAAGRVFLFNDLLPVGHILSGLDMFDRPQYDEIYATLNLTLFRLIQRQLSSPLDSGMKSRINLRTAARQSSPARRPPAEDPHARARDFADLFRKWGLDGQDLIRTCEILARAFAKVFAGEYLAPEQVIDEIRGLGISNESVEGWISTLIAETNVEIYILGLGEGKAAEGALFYYARGHLPRSTTETSLIEILEKRDKGDSDPKIRANELINGLDRARRGFASSPAREIGEAIRRGAWPVEPYVTQLEPYRVLPSDTVIPRGIFVGEFEIFANVDIQRLMQIISNEKGRELDGEESRSVQRWAEIIREIELNKARVICDWAGIWDGFECTIFARRAQKILSPKFPWREVVIEDFYMQRLREKEPRENNHVCTLITIAGIECMLDTSADSFEKKAEGSGFHPYRYHYLGVVVIPLSAIERHKERFWMYRGKTISIRGARGASSPLILHRFALTRRSATRFANSIRGSPGSFQYLPSPVPYLQSSENPTFSSLAGQQVSSPTSELLDGVLRIYEALTGKIESADGWMHMVRLSKTDEFRIWQEQLGSLLSSGYVIDFYDDMSKTFVLGENFFSYQLCDNPLTPFFNYLVKLMFAANVLINSAEIDGLLGSELSKEILGSPTDLVIRKGAESQSLLIRLSTEDSIQIRSIDGNWTPREVGPGSIMGEQPDNPSRVSYDWYVARFDYARLRGLENLTTGRVTLGRLLRSLHRHYATDERVRWLDGAPGFGMAQRQLLEDPKYESLRPLVDMTAVDLFNHSLTEIDEVDFISGDIARVDLNGEYGLITLIQVWKYLSDP
ncbi:hypothetical protein ACFL96_18825, partial [Thermoproteota archaeon]